MQSYYLIYLVIFGVFIAVAMYLSAKRTKSRLAQTIRGAQELNQALIQAAQAGAQPGEIPPITVIAFHHKSMLIVGATDQRVLVMKADGILHSAPYDYEGEHLPAKEKESKRRGYFNWSHEPGKGYWASPTAREFAGESWLMPIAVQGHPQQKEGLADFAFRFYFQWFYG